MTDGLSDDTKEKYELVFTACRRHLEKSSYLYIKIGMIYGILKYQYFVDIPESNKRYLLNGFREIYKEIKIFKHPKRLIYPLYVNYHSAED